MLEENRTNKYLTLKNTEEIDFFEDMNQPKYLNVLKNFTKNKLLIKSLQCEIILSYIGTNSQYFRFTDWIKT